MNRLHFPRKLKKTLETAAILSVLLLLVGFLFLRGQNSAPPASEEGTPSKMYVVTTDLAVDESALADVENANINDGVTEDEPEPEEQEDAKEQVQEDTPREPEENPQNQETEVTDPETIQPDSRIPDHQTDSLISLIQKKDPEGNPQKGTGDGDTNKTPGGDGDGTGDGDGQGDGTKPGQGTTGTLTEEEAAELFYTSIVDGEVVTDPDYYFTITLTEKGRALTLVSQTVTLNGSSSNFANGDHVTLSEGANSITVTLRFRDQANNQVDAPSKNYTVYYYRNNRYYLTVSNKADGAQIMDGQTLYVSDPSICLQVVAGRVTNEEFRATSPRVRCNQGMVYANGDGDYETALRVGENEFNVSVGTGVNQLQLSFIVNYVQENFALTLTSNGADAAGNTISDTVTRERYDHQSSYTWTSDDQNFGFILSISKLTGLESIDHVYFTKNGSTTEITSRVDASGVRTVTLEGYNQDADNYRGNKIRVDFTDSFGNHGTYTWIIVYQRASTPAELTPYVSVNLRDGQTLNDTPYQMYIMATDHLGNTLTDKHFTVTLNGKSIPLNDIKEHIYYGYLLHLEEGPNTVVVTVKDNDQYTNSQTFQINYRDVEEIVYVNLKVDMQVLGLSAIIDETVAVSNKATVARVVEDRLAAYGYSTRHNGTPETSDYYLTAIEKTGIINGWILTEEQRNHYADEMYDIFDPYSNDSLMEKDFTTGSGWMVTVNGVFISTGMGQNLVRDGDSIRVQYTLDLGKDIQVSAGDGR